MDKSLNVLSSIEDLVISIAGMPEASWNSVLENMDTDTLRRFYAAAYEGEYSMDGDLGEHLARTAPKDQLVNDLIFWLEAQV